MDYSVKNEGTIEYFAEKIAYFILPSEKNSYTSKFLQSRILLYFVILVLILKIFSVAVSINFPNNVFFADITKTALENFANQTRLSVGLSPLAENAKLNEAAQLKAQNMVQNQYFDHTSPSGITPWHWFSKAGYNYKYAGENLAIGFYESEEVFNAWLNSPSHKANIVNPNYKEFGTAVLSGFGPNNAIVVVQEFGAQLPAKTTAVKNTPPVQTQITQNPKPVQAQQEVLSGQTADSIGQPDNAGSDSLSFKILNSMIYSYDSWLQGIVYGISMVVIGILLVIIFLNSNITFRKEFVFRSVLIAALLSVTLLANRNLIVSIIPHQIFI